jgi:hypothetical protein
MSDISNINYNIFDQMQVPNLLLCNPNKTKLCSLPLAYNIKNTIRYNAISEIEFKYPKILNNIPSPETKPKKNYTAISLGFDGENNSTDFVDETGNIWTQTGSPVISTTQYRYGTAAGYFSDKTYRIETAPSANFDLLDHDWAFNLWVYFDVLPDDDYTDFFIQEDSDGGIYLGYSQLNETLMFYSASEDWETIFDFHAPQVLEINRWYHLSYERYGEEAFIFVDDVSQPLEFGPGGEITGKSMRHFNTNASIGVGGGIGSGYIDEFLFLNGIAFNAYIDNPPITENVQNTNLEYDHLEGKKLLFIDSNNFLHANDVNLKILLHMDGSDQSSTFIDETGRPWTKTGVPNIDTSKYVLGNASGKFRTSDHISTHYTTEIGNINFGARDWAAGFRVNFLTDPTGVDCFFMWQIKTALLNGGIFLLYRENNNLYCSFSEVIGMSVLKYWEFYSPWTPSASTWYSVLIERKGNTPYIFIDGISQPVTQNTPMLAIPAPNIIGAFNIGNREDASGGITYNLDEVFLWQGVSFYTENFVVPTVPYETSKGSYYILNNVVEQLDGATPIKQVNAVSLEAEFLSRRLTGFTGTYAFLDLLERTLRPLPTWSIGTVDASLLLLYRTFTSNNKTIYDFLVNDMEKAYGCVFEFDTVNKTVSAITNVIPPIETKTFLSFDNLISKIEFKKITEEICTALYCYGGDNLDIRNVNPLGGAVIYDFSYFKTSNWMNTGLISSLTDWENKLETQQPIYANLLATLEVYNSEMIILETEMTDLLGQLAAMEETKAAILAQIPPGDPDILPAGNPINVQIANLYLLIALKNEQLSSKQVLITTTTTSIRKIVHSLFFTSKISFDNFLDDIDTIGENLATTWNNWQETYNVDSGYPYFDPGYLVAQTQNITILMVQATEQLGIINDYLNAGFSSYPPPDGNLTTLAGYINNMTSILSSLLALLQSIIPNTVTTITVDNTINWLASYLEIIYYSENMTYDQYLELSTYIYENTYTNNNIVQTDIMTVTEIQAQSQSLYDQSLVVLAKISQPRYEFSGTFSNFIALKEFSSFTASLQMGKAIYVKKDDDGTPIEAILLEITINYDNPTDFDMTFGNSYRLDNSNFIYGDLLGNAAQIGMGVA